MNSGAMTAQVFASTAHSPLTPTTSTLAAAGGKTLLALHRAAEALADFEQAGALRPQSAEPLFMAGVARMDLGRSHAALARFEQANHPGSR